MELGMSDSVFDSLVGQRIKNKLIEHAYAKDYKGSHDDLLDSIYALESIIKIVEKSVIDVIEGEIETFSFRNMEEASGLINVFIGGLIHAKDLIENDSSTIGLAPLE
jgi:hypothetical protein